MSQYDLAQVGLIHTNYIALRYMGKDKGGNGGAIVNIASVAGIDCSQFSTPTYNATKHGVVAFTRSLGVRTVYQRKCRPVFNEKKNVFPIDDVGRILLQRNGRQIYDNLPGRHLYEISGQHPRTVLFGRSVCTVQKETGRYVDANVSRHSGIYRRRFV